MSGTTRETVTPPTDRCLHAAELGFVHPLKNEEVKFSGLICLMTFNGCWLSSRPEDVSRE